MTINPEDVAHVAAANRRFHPPLLGTGAALTDQKRLYDQQQKALDAAAEALVPALPRNEEHARAWAKAAVDAYLRAMNERWWDDDPNAR
jgi:hypothetical protein